MTENPETTEQLPEGFTEFLNELRPFTGGTLVLLKQTRNEWLDHRPASQMLNPYFATLAWLFIQHAPLRRVNVAAFGDPAEFPAEVLRWSDERKVTPEQLAAANAVIQHTLKLADDAEQSVLA